MDLSDLIAIKIKEIMKNKNISTYKLESLSGVYSSTISTFLTRKTKTIRIENLMYICEAFNITLGEFFSDKRFTDAEAHDWIKAKKNNS